MNSILTFTLLMISGQTSSEIFINPVLIILTFSTPLRPVIFPIIFLIWFTTYQADLQAFFSHLYNYKK